MLAVYRAGRASASGTSRASASCFSRRMRTSSAGGCCRGRVAMAITPPAAAVTIPRPLLLVVDDTGWRSGDDRSGRGEAGRAGVTRCHTDADYQALAALAARLRMRVQCGMILCDWDRDSICAAHPTTTWLGAGWQNKELGDGAWAERAKRAPSRRSAFSRPSVLRAWRR